MLGRLLRAIGLGPPSGLGPRGERAAEAYLKSRGFVMLDRNVRVPMGEADLVMRDPQGVVVVVEVKARVVDPKRPRPRAESQVGRHKQGKLRAVMVYLQKANGWEKVRIDVVGVDFAPGEDAPVAVRHFVGAVGG